MGWAATLFLGIPLLFAAVWARSEVLTELGIRDELLAERERLEHSLLELRGERTRLSTWGSIGSRAREMGLRPPFADEVVWVQVREIDSSGG